MNIQPIRTKAEYQDLKSAQVKNSKPEKLAETTQKTDVFVKETVTDEESIGYTRPKNLTSDQLKDISEQQAASFQKMLSSMIGKQGEAYNLSMRGMNFNVSIEESQNAASAIADGGPYSVDAVAGRIMDMAYALSGGDSSKIETLRDAVQKGFKAAGVEFGQGLPQICNDTYDEVMRRFDEWEKKGIEE